MIDDPLLIPDPLQNSLGSIIGERPKRTRPAKKRSVVPGDFLADSPRKKPNRRAPMARETPTVDPELLRRLAACGKWVPHLSVIRYAIYHCVRATPQTAFIDDVTVWDRLGRWASETRSVKTSDEFCGRHMALGHLQRLVVGIRGIEANPVRSRLLHSEASQYLKTVVIAWEAALEKFLEAHPDFLQTPDEFAGFQPMHQAPVDVHRGLLIKPVVASKAHPAAQREVQGE